MSPRLLCCALVSGAAGAAVVAIAESAAGFGPSPVATAVAALGLLLPIGVIAGAGLAATWWLLPPGKRPADWARILASPRDPEASGAILSIGLFALALLPVVYRVIHFFMCAFHHQGLAALALTAALVAVAAAIALVGPRLCSAAGALAERLAGRFGPAGRPAVAAAIVVAAWIAAIAPPLARGPEDISGVFGFVGLLAKDGLGAGPLVSLAAIAAMTASGISILSRRAGGAIRWIAAACVVAALLGPVWAAAAIGAAPESADRLDSSGGLARLAAALGRKLGDSDGDGHSRWMGGRDCDDRDPSVHPGARDLPDNGIDEDCSGGDLSIAALKAAAGAEPEPDADAPELRRPDLPKDASLFLITVDAMRWNAPGFMGYERNVTPNLDRLVADGTIYERAYGLGSYTAQAVPPMMTGKYASELIRNDRHETRFSGKETFAAEVVCREGRVRCGAVLSHFLFEPFFGWNQGFHDWRVVGGEPAGPGHIDSKYNSHSVANQAMRWLRKEENTAGSFWLWTHFMDPHKEYLEHKGFKRFGVDRRARYDHELLFTDHHIGRMIDFFLELPAAERTVFVVTADHGEAFNEHGRWCHGKELWEEIIRVPLAVAGPGIPKKRVARQTSHIDVFPTILDFFGADVPEGIHGRSLLPDWVEGQELPERPIFADQPNNNHYETRRVFVSDGWKLHDLPETGTHRLYRIGDDYERGDSLVEAEPEAFRRIKAAYDLFMATEVEMIDPVHWGGSSVDDMPDPRAAAAE